jgi:hypothetical protein
LTFHTRLGAFKLPPGSCPYQGYTTHPVPRGTFHTGAGAFKRILPLQGYNFYTEKYISHRVRGVQEDLRESAPPGVQFLYRGVHFTRGQGHSRHPGDPAPTQGYSFYTYGYVSHGGQLRGSRGPSGFCSSRDILSFTEGTLPKGLEAFKRTQGTNSSPGVHFLHRGVHFIQGQGRYRGSRPRILTSPSRGTLS